MSTSESTSPDQNQPQAQRRPELRQAALDYHEYPRPGKISVEASKQLVNQHDLALAYSPGVAAPCEEIVQDPAAAFRYTARGNLVGVVTNGTAVLGLGDIGALAGKPVMEGKGVLFKKFAGIDVFDIEINEKDPDKLVEIIAANVSLSPKDQRRVASFNLRFRLVRSSEAQKADAANEVVAGK